MSTLWNEGFPLACCLLGRKAPQGSQDSAPRRASLCCREGRIFCAASHCWLWPRGGRCRVGWAGSLELTAGALWAGAAAHSSPRHKKELRQVGGPCGSGMLSCQAASCPAEESVRSCFKNVCFNLRILITWGWLDSMIYNPARIPRPRPPYGPLPFSLLYTYHFPLFIFSDWCSGSGCFLLWDS